MKQTQPHILKFSNKKKTLSQLTLIPMKQNKTQILKFEIKHK